MFGGVERQLLNYFILIALAALMIGGEFAVELSSAEAGTLDLHALRNKVVVMFFVLTIVVAIVLLMFVRNITHPIQRMVDAAQQINRGDLSQVVTLDQNDELGELATAINGLTSNLQEVAALSAHTSDAMLSELEAISGELRASGSASTAETLEPRLERLEEAARSLDDLVGAFDLLEPPSRG